MKTRRINDLARELGIKSREVLNILTEIGVGGKAHASSLNEDDVAKVRAQLEQGNRAVARHESKHYALESLPIAQVPTRALSHSSGQGNRDLREALIARGLIKPNERAVTTKHVVREPPPTRKLIVTKLANGGTAKKQERNGGVKYGRVSQVEKNKLLKRMERVQQRSSPLVQAGKLTKSLAGVTFRILAAPQPPIKVDSRPTICCKVKGETGVVCNAIVHQDRMELHMKNNHAKEQDSQSQHLPTEQFPFILLPPGNWEYQKIFEHYRKRSQHNGFSEQNFDSDRTRQVNSLNPVLRHFGLKAWFGYGVYEFSYSSRVLLESFVSNNAAYIVSGDWTEMIRISKAELRKEFASSYTKVVHTGEWLTRIDHALRDK
jgi:hypothetical protein